MASNQRLRDIVLLGCRLVDELVGDRMAIAEFLGRWGNLYYEHALEDAGPAIAPLEHAVQLLRRVQHEVVDQIVPPDGGDEPYLAVGRIPVTAVRERIERVLAELDTSSAVALVDG